MDDLKTFAISFTLTVLTLKLVDGINEHFRKEVREIVRDEIHEEFRKEVCKEVREVVGNGIFEKVCEIICEENGK